MHRPGPHILDGSALAKTREPLLAQRASSVRRVRGRAPCIALLATGRAGETPPHVARKQHAAATLGVETRLHTLPPEATTADVRRAILEAAAAAPDALFVQYPLPDGVDAATAFEAIPPEMDADVLSVMAFRRFLEGAGAAPATAEAAVLLLDAYALDVRGRRAAVLGAAGDLARAHVVLLERRGAHPVERLDPDDPATPAKLAAAQLVVTAGGIPGRVPLGMLAADALAIDGGYFNPGGRGDFGAGGSGSGPRWLVPVPGGLGPMTISVLLERTIARAGG